MRVVLQAGTCQVHIDLEKEVADFVGKPAACVFGTVVFEVVCCHCNVCAKVWASQRIVQSFQYFVDRRCLLALDVCAALSLTCSNRT